MDILLSGATGRMGKEILSCIEKEKDLNVICGFGMHENYIRKYSDL